MQEDKQDTQRTDIFHQEQIEVEIMVDTQGAAIGKFIVNQLVRYEPTNHDTGQEAYDRQEDLSCHEVEDIKQRLFEEMQRGTSRAK